MKGSREAKIVVQSCADSKAIRLALKVWRRSLGHSFPLYLLALAEFLSPVAWLQITLW